MFRIFILLGLLFLSILVFYPKQIDRDVGELQVTRLEGISDDLSSNEDSENSEINTLPIVDSGPKDKTLLREVALSPGDIEQLKLKDFHAYLRHEERVENQMDGSVSADILSPEQRKDFARERLAVKLIDKLNSEKEK